MDAMPLCIMVITWPMESTRGQNHRQIAVERDKIAERDVAFQNHVAAPDKVEHKADREAQLNER